MPKTAAYSALNFTFNYNAVVFNDLFTVFFKLPIADKIAKTLPKAGGAVGLATEIASSATLSVGINTLAGILGFSYNTNQDIPLLEYEYSDQPYLNKAMLCYSAIKQSNDFSIVVNSIVTKLTPYVSKIGVFTGYKKLLEYYADNGGTFSILTPYTVITPCVLTSLKALHSTTPGTQFEIGLKRINIASSGILKQLSSKIGNIASGGIVNLI